MHYSIATGTTTTLEPGALLRLSASVDSWGARASTTATLLFVLSEDDTFDTTDIQLCQVFLNALSVGASLPASRQCQLPPWLPRGASYYLGACVLSPDGAWPSHCTRQGRLLTIREGKSDWVVSPYQIEPYRHSPGRCRGSDGSGAEHWLGHRAQFHDELLSPRGASFCWIPAPVALTDQPPRRAPTQWLRLPLRQPQPCPPEPSRCASRVRWSLELSATPA